MSKILSNINHSIRELKQFSDDETTLLLLESNAVKKLSKGHLDYIGNDEIAAARKIALAILDKETEEKAEQALLFNTFVAHAATLAQLTLPEQDHPYYEYANIIDFAINSLNTKNSDDVQLYTSQSTEYKEGNKKIKECARAMSDINFSDDSSDSAHQFSLLMSRVDEILNEQRIDNNVRYHEFYNYNKLKKCARTILNYKLKSDHYNAVHQFLLTLAEYRPLNTKDVISGRSIKYHYPAYLSEGYQFSVNPLHTKKNINPYNGEVFSIRDSNHFNNALIKERKSFAAKATLGACVMIGAVGIALSIVLSSAVIAIVAAISLVLIGGSALYYYSNLRIQKQEKSNFEKLKISLSHKLNPQLHQKTVNDGNKNITKRKPDSLGQTGIFSKIKSSIAQNSDMPDKEIALADISHLRLKP